MASKSYQYNKESVSGIHIYEDEKGRKIYYQPRRMRGFVIKDENVKSYQVYANRFMIPVLAGLVAYIAFGESGFAGFVFFFFGLFGFLIFSPTLIFFCLNFFFFCSFSPFGGDSPPPPIQTPPP